MKYLGGKSKLGKQIGSILNSSIFETGKYLEPFVGANNIVRHISIHCDSLICSDSHQGLITMYKALQDGWLPPDYLSKDEYLEIKSKNDQFHPITAFAAFGCSFSGKEWGGYASGENRNFCGEAKRSLIKMMKDPQFKNIDFKCCDFSSYDDIKEYTIYCDPPYQNTTKYKTSFDHSKFWNWCNEISHQNIVFVSEMTLPPHYINYDIEWSKTRKISVSLGDYKEKTEYLFRINQ